MGNRYRQRYVDLSVNGRDLAANVSDAFKNISTIRRFLENPTFHESGKRQCLQKRFRCATRVLSMTHHSHGHEHVTCVSAA